MNGVAGVAAAQAVATQSQVQGEVALHVMKVQRDTQALLADMTQQALEDVTRAMQAGGVDLYG